MPGTGFRYMVANLYTAGMDMFPAKFANIRVLYQTVCRVLYYKLCKYEPISLVYIYIFRRRREISREFARIRGGGGKIYKSSIKN